MLFTDLDDALSALETPGALNRYRQTLVACGNADEAARETCKHTDDQVHHLRTMLEAIRNKAPASVDSGQFELRLVTPLEAQPESPESRGYRRRNISDFDSSQLDESTPIPSMTPTKIKTEANSPTSSCTEEQSGDHDEDQSNNYRLDMRSSSNPPGSQGKAKQDPRARLRGASSTRASESTDSQQHEIIDEFERQRNRHKLHSATSSKPAGSDTKLAGLMEDVDLEDTRG